MKVKYIRCDGFTAVLTPHFRQQYTMRERLREGLSLGIDLLERIFAKSTEDETVGVLFGNGYVYSKKKYNWKRGRWELELITFTPSDFLQTETKRFAKRIEV